MKIPSKMLGVLAVSCAFAGMAPGSASASVAPTVRIARVVYDPSGPDTHSNVQLNRETVELKNTGKHSVAMKGWTLRDTSHHVYVFGGFTLRAGRWSPSTPGSGRTRHGISTRIVAGTCGTTRATRRRSEPLPDGPSRPVDGPTTAQARLTASGGRRHPRTASRFAGCRRRARAARSTAGRVPAR